MTRLAAVACALAGASWLALIPASVLLRDGDLSYDGYYRVLAVPLLLFALAWLALRPVWPRDWRAELGYWATLAGLVLVFAGDALEFWGAWLTGKTNAFEAYRTGGESWWGSDLGWTLFILGTLALFFGGPTAAVAGVRARLVPVWGGLLLALFGLGVLSGNLLDDAAPAATVAVFGAWGLGWIGLGLALARDGPRAR